jgi:hypothetical protein
MCTVVLQQPVPATVTIVSVFCRQIVIKMTTAGRMIKLSYVILDFRQHSTHSFWLTVPSMVSRNKTMISEKHSLSPRMCKSHSQNPIRKVGFFSSLYGAILVHTVSAFHHTAGFTDTNRMEHCLTDIFGHGANLCNTSATRSFLPELRGLKRSALVTISLRYTT